MESFQQAFRMFRIQMTEGWAGTKFPCAMTHSAGAPARGRADNTRTLAHHRATPLPYMPAAQTRTFAGNHAAVS